MDKFYKAYKQRYPALQRACRRLQSMLKQVKTAIEDKKLVRAEIDCLRVKSLSSLKRKAQEKGWKADEALYRCGDLIGGRVVCNNIEDVYRFAELLKERLPSYSGDFEMQDYIKNPDSQGYRALHVHFRLEVGDHPFESDLMPCEVQIRSRLQDAWAKLSHVDIYKQPNLPEDLRARFKDLSEVVTAADKIASEIRLRVRKEIDPPEERPNLDHVSQEGLAFIFRDVFGRSPSDYVIRIAQNLCRELNIASLEELPTILGREEFRKKVEEAYRSIMLTSIGVEDIFLCSLYALAKGEPKALAQVKRTAQKEWREIDRFARSEALSSLPTTIEELIKKLEYSSAETDVEGWAEALGATGECAICNTTIINPLSFAEAAVQHYELSDDSADDTHEWIETAVRNSGVETGGWGDGSLCAYHNEQMAKDD